MLVLVLGVRLRLTATAASAATPATARTPQPADPPTPTPPHPTPPCPGIFIASLINYGVNESGSEHGWRISLGMAGVPAIILFAAGLVLPETPSSLIERGRTEQGRRVLAKLRGVSEEEVGVEFEDICEASTQAARVSIASSWAAIFRRRYRPQLIVTTLIAALQQLTGINAIMVGMAWGWGAVATCCAPSPLS